jgi:hypothetical protein
MRRILFTQRPFVSKPLSIGLALLFVGLQIATLFHGASYGFASHSHSSKTIIAFDTPVLDVFGFEQPQEQRDRTPDPFCDLDMFCDKLDKLAVAPQADIQGLSHKVTAQRAGLAALFGAEWQEALARGPPSFLQT